MHVCLGIIKVQEGFDDAVAKKARPCYYGLSLALLLELNPPF